MHHAVAACSEQSLKRPFSSRVFLSCVISSCAESCADTPGAEQAGNTVLPSACRTAEMRLLAGTADELLPLFGPLLNPGRTDLIASLAKGPVKSRPLPLCSMSRAQRRGKVNRVNSVSSSETEKWFVFSQDESVAQNVLLHHSDRSTPPTASPRCSL